MYYYYNMSYKEVLCGIYIGVIIIIYVYVIINIFNSNTI
jgi:hypothetical protein